MAMSLYKIENGPELKASIVDDTIAGWKKEAPDVCLITDDGSKCYFHRSLLSLHSPFLSLLLTGSPVYQDTSISVPMTRGALSALLRLLSDGQTGVGGDGLDDVKEAAEILGVMIGELETVLPPGIVKQEKGKDLGKRMQEKVKQVLQRVNQNNKVTKVKSPAKAIKNSKAKIARTLTPRTLAPMLSTPRTSASKTVNLRTLPRSLSLKTLTTAGIEKLLEENDESETSSNLVISAVPSRIGVSRSASNLLSSGRKDSKGVTSAHIDTSSHSTPNQISIKNLNVSDCESALGAGFCDTGSLLSVPGSMVIKQEPGLVPSSLETVNNKSKVASQASSVGSGVESKENMVDKRPVGNTDKKMTGAMNKNIGGLSIKSESGVDRKVVGKTKQKAAVCPRYQSKNNVKDGIPIKRTMIKKEIMENGNKSKPTNSRINMQIKNGKFETKVKPVLRQSGSTSRLARKGSQSSRRIPKTVQSRRTPQPRVTVKKPQGHEEPLKIIKNEREDADEVSIEYEETEESQCPYCLKQFANWNYLSKHMTKVHVNEV